MLRSERLSGSWSGEAGSICRGSILVFRLAARRNHKGGIEWRGRSWLLLPFWDSSHASVKFEKLDWSDWVPAASEVAVRVCLGLSSSHVHLGSNAAACFSELFMSSSLNIHV